MKQVRIKDIAKLSGFSIGTVDRVLHNRGEVAADTKEKILKIARELDYKPNIVAQALTTKKQYRIAVLIPRADKDNSFWAMHPAGINKALNELRPFKVNVSYYLFELHNEADFLSKAEELLNDEPEGVILAPILRKESLHICSRLEEKGVPYIFIDSHIENCGNLSFLGENAYKSGRVAASLVDFGVGADNDILVVNIAKDLENTRHLYSRTRGFMNYFGEGGRNKGRKITVEIESSNMDTVRQKLNKVFADYPDIGAILVSSAKTHIVASYLEEKGLKDIILVGYEMTKENLDFLKHGIINFLIGQRPVESSEKALKMMFEHLTTGKTFSKEEFQPVEIINPENADF